MQTRGSHKRSEEVEEYESPSFPPAAAQEASLVEKLPEVEFCIEQIAASIRQAAENLIASGGTIDLSTIPLSYGRGPFAIISLSDNTVHGFFHATNPIQPGTVDMAAMLPADPIAAAAAVNEIPDEPLASAVCEPAGRRYAPPLEKLTQWDNMNNLSLADRDQDMDHEDDQDDHDARILGDTDTLHGCDKGNSDSDDDPDDGHQQMKPRRRSARTLKCSKKQGKGKKQLKVKNIKMKKETKPKKCSQNNTGRPGRIPKNDAKTVLAVLEKITRNPKLTMKTAAAAITKKNLERAQRHKKKGQELSEIEKKRASLSESTLRKRVPVVTGGTWTRLTDQAFQKEVLEDIMNNYPDIYDQFIADSMAGDGLDDEVTVAGDAGDSSDDEDEDDVNGAGAGGDGEYNKVVDALGSPQCHQTRFLEEEEDEEEDDGEEDQEEDEEDNDEEEEEKDVGKLITIKKENYSSRFYQQQEQEPSLSFGQSSDQHENDGDDENGFSLPPIKLEDELSFDDYNDLMANSTLLPAEGLPASPRQCTSIQFLGTPPAPEESYSQEESPRR